MLADHEYCVVQKGEVRHVNTDSLGKYKLVTNCSSHITKTAGLTSNIRCCNTSINFALCVVLVVLFS